MKQKPKEKLVLLVFIVYILTVFLLLFGRTRGSSEIPYHELLRTNFNYIPLKTITRYVRALRNGRYVRTAVVNLFGNILLFVPFGFFLPRVYRKAENFLTFLRIQTEIIVLAEAVPNAMASSQSSLICSHVAVCLSNVWSTVPQSSFCVIFFIHPYCW